MKYLIGYDKYYDDMLKPTRHWFGGCGPDENVIIYGPYTSLPPPQLHGKTDADVAYVTVLGFIDTLMQEDGIRRVMVAERVP